MNIEVELKRIQNSIRHKLYGLPHIVAEEPQAIFPMVVKYFGGSLPDWTVNVPEFDTFIRSLQHVPHKCQAFKLLQNFALFTCPIRLLEPIWVDIEIKGLMGRRANTLLNQWERITPGFWTIHNVSGLWIQNKINPHFVIDSVKIDIGVVRDRT